MIMFGINYMSIMSLSHIYRHDAINIFMLSYFIQDYNGETALHLAIRSKNEKLANLLIEAPQIDYTVRDAQAYTVFHVAVDLRQRAIAQSLLKKDPSLALQVSY